VKITPTTGADPDVLWRREGDEVSDDAARLDRPAVHHFLSTQAYWCLGMPRETLDRAIDHSLCFGVYRGRAQVGFARVVTDRATYAYLCDVYIEPAMQGAASAHGSSSASWRIRRCRACAACVW